MMLNAAYTFGRICLPIVFIVSGIQKAMNVEAVAALLASKHVPVPDAIVPYLGGVPKYHALGYLVAAVETIGGLMVLIGLRTRWAALVLAVFTASTIIFVHHFWDMSGEDYSKNLMEALKNLSILGGLLLLVSAGAGPSSMDQR